MTEPRSDDAIRTEEQPPPGTEVERLVHALEHIGKLLDAATARAVAAEARAERAEGTEDQMLTHLTLMTARVVRLSRRAAAVEAALAELSDVRVYGERNSTYYCGAQTMAKRVRAALAAAAPPREDETAQEPAKPCEGFRWIGQTFASCDRCGLPFWEHTHSVEIDRESVFDVGFNFKLVPITPEQAAACARKWCPTCSGSSRETVGMVCQTCGTDYDAPREEPARRFLATTAELNVARARLEAVEAALLTGGQSAEIRCRAALAVLSGEVGT